MVGLGASYETLNNLVSPISMGPMSSVGMNNSSSETVQLAVISVVESRSKTLRFEVNFFNGCLISGFISFWSVADAYRMFSISNLSGISITVSWV